MTYQQQITIHTSGHGDMHDLTEQVSAAVATSSIQTGTVNVFNVGSTAAVDTIEFEPGLQQDLPNIFDRLIPPSRNFGNFRLRRRGSPGQPGRRRPATQTARATRTSQNRCGPGGATLPEKDRGNPPGGSPRPC